MTILEQANPPIAIIIAVVLIAISGFVTLFAVASKSISAKSSQTVKTVDDIALEVLAGLWGNGDDRKNRIVAAGYDYEEVQEVVNKLLENRK